MAFFRKAGNILRQNVSKHINQEISASNPSIFQMIRCMSTSKIFVGGLSYSTDDTSLREAFRNYGEVFEARVIVDRETGRSRGFGFVTFATPEDASSAIQALDGQELHGRTVRVNFANDRPRDSVYGAGSYGSGGNYGGGGDRNGWGGGNRGSGYGGNSYGSGVTSGSYSGNGGDSYAGGGSYASGNSYDSGSGVGFGGDNQNFGVAGIGGSANYASGGGGNSGYDGNTGGDQFGSNQTSNIADAEGGHSQDVPLGGNYRDDDDEPGDYANRRA